jgi:serine/threonine protein kinase
VQTIGRYEVVDRMGSGGFATVYRARDPHLDSEVAIKVLAENWADNTEFKDRFTREAQLLRRIDSDHVVTVHDIGETESGQPFFVMALADRGTLEDRLADRPPPSGNDAVAIAERLADCVGTIHSHDMIHRDIKPSNLLIAATRRSSREPAVAGILESNERLVLGDFGLAKDTALTGGGLTIAAGTGGYAAPEQMSQTGVPDRRTDIYAATAVMYRVVSGTRPPPFDLASQSVPFVDGDWWMKGALGAFLRHGMAFQQSSRHRDLDEWFDEFRRAVLQLTGGGSSSAPTVAAPPGGEPGLWSSPPAAPSAPVVDRDPRSYPSAPAVDRDPRSYPSAPAVSGPPGTPGGGPVATPAVHPIGSDPRSMPRYEPPQPSMPVARASSRSAPGDHGGGYGAGAGGAESRGLQQIRPIQTSSQSRGALLIVPVLLVAAMLAGGWYLMTRSEAPVIEGDDEVAAGEPAFFTADLEGADEYRWTNFDGSQAVGDVFEVTGILPGTLELEVTAFGDGEELGTGSRTIEVVASPEGPTIIGPDTVALGEIGEFTLAEVDTLANPVWVLDDGSEQPGAIFQVEPSSPGSFTLTLKVDNPSGFGQIGNRRVIELVE